MASNGEDPEDLRNFTTMSFGRSDDGYAIPDAPLELKQTRWLAYTESISIAGLGIKKGFLYVGPTLVAPSGMTDPALIDPRKAVASNGDYSAPHLSQRPDYSETTPIARRSYLQWLADGRSAPNADIAYVFLYFYGLERRIILDNLRDGNGTGDFPNLYKELKRLYALFADKSGAFRRSCAQLIELVEVAASEERLYRNDVDAFQSAYGFPFLIRLALGQAVSDGVPIPAALALTWADHDPRIVRRTAVTKCAAEFKILFISTYAAMHGDGMRIAPNKTKLKLSYQPASAGFDGSGGVEMNFGDTPDIAALTGPVKLLQEVVEVCASKLDSFSRFLARNPHGRDTFEGILTLPVELWPEQSKAELSSISSHVASGPKTIKFAELVAYFTAENELGKDQQHALLNALTSHGVSSEPRILGTSRTFALTDSLVLFECGDPGGDARASDAYKVARLSVELGAAIAHADGNFSDVELTHLIDNIDRWEHLDCVEQSRLKAYAYLLRVAPPSLSSMKKNVDAFDGPTRAGVAAFAASMVLADGAASPQEVRLLEKFYQQLGLARVNVYRDIHSHETKDGLPARSSDAAAPVASTPFALDVAKIAALHAESRIIAERLALIFAGEEETSIQPATVAERLCTTSVMGLDEAHSAFARILTSRASWQRIELTNVAEDLSIMLDGGLERINEASLDQHDVFFTEGDDPIEINPEIVEILAQ